MNENDFLLFDNVIHVDAGDNNLPLCKFNSGSYSIIIFLTFLVLNDTVTGQFNGPYSSVHHLKI